MIETRAIVSSALEARSAAGIKVRQPLASLAINTSLPQEYLDIIADELNVKSVSVDTTHTDPIVLDTVITPELQKEGLFREFVRDIQDLRKEKNLQPSDAIILHIQTDAFGWDIIHSFEKDLQSITGTKACVPYGEKVSTPFDRESKFEDLAYAVVCEQIVGE
jgi:isoleucyl-tRNA synthetase